MLGQIIFSTSKPRQAVLHIPLRFRWQFDEEFARKLAYTVAAVLLGLLLHGRVHAQSAPQWACSSVNGGHAASGSVESYSACAAESAVEYFGRCGAGCAGDYAGTVRAGNCGIPPAYVGQACSGDSDLCNQFNQCYQYYLNYYMVAVDSNPQYFVSASTPPLVQTISPDPFGDPINPAVGNVYTTETDVKFTGSSAIAFQQFYNSADTAGADGVPGWRHSYGRSISTVYQATRSPYPGQSTLVSPQYSTQALACTSGFAAIRGSVSAWAGATATYSGSVCVIANGSTTISTLPIQVYPPPAPPPAAIEYDVIRDDGQTLRYPIMSNGTVSNPPGVSTRLAVIGSGFTVTDDQDNVESYNATGVLQSITSRAGVVETLSYTSGAWSGVTDSFGQSLTVARNAHGSIASITLTGGGLVQYAYDTSLRFSTVTNLDNTSRTYIYGDSRFLNALASIIDENQTTYSSWSYDAQERALTSQLAGGANAATLVYNSNESVKTTDALGAVRTFIYTRVGDVNQSASISGSQCPTCQESAATMYDAAGFVASRTDYNGNVTCYANDPVRGLELARVEGFASGSSCPSGLASYTPASGTSQRKITTAWNTTWREPNSITEANRVTSFSYDGAGNALTKTVTDTSASPNVSRTWTFTYNSFGQVLTAKSPRTDVNGTTTYTYYTCTTGGACGQVNTMTNAVGQVTTFNTYNGYGQPLTITDPNGVVTTLAYDARQRMTSRQVGSETTSYSYYPTGLLHVVTLADASTLTMTYDGAHRLTKIADGAGNYVSYTLDAMGNRTAESAYDSNNVLSRTHSRAFNTLSQLYQDIGANGTSITTWGYDANGNPTSSAAPLSRTTASQYDALNRLQQITDPGTGITHITYDANDNVASVTDPTALQTSYTHNGFNDLTTQVSPSTGTTTNTYDSGGNLASSTDARGAITTYGYDALNRVISASYKIGGVTDQTISYSYDTGSNGKGRLVGATDASHALAWSYDTLGRVIGKGQTVGGVTKSVGYGYTNGDITTLTTPSGQVVSYSYANHQVTGISINGSALLSSAAYEPFGPVRGWTWGNATTEVRLHDTDGNQSQLTGVEAKSLSYDAGYRLTSLTNSSNSALSWTVGYDPLDRVTSAAQTGSTLGYSYDANGNRSGQTGAAAPGLMWTNGATFTYNARGRMSSANSATNYTYNALGQMIQKSGTSTTLLMYDEAGHLLGEYNASGALIQETVWLGDTPVATLRPNGAAISVYYVHADQLNAPRLVSRPADNAILWRWDSDPFGVTQPNQNPQALGTFVYNLRFPGQYYQAETGLHYNYFRDYDAGSGRYVKSDPIGLGGGANTYAYASGNPVSNVDPLGLRIQVIGVTPSDTAALNAAVAALNTNIGNYSAQLINQLENSPDLYTITNLYNSISPAQYFPSKKTINLDPNFHPTTATQCGNEQSQTPIILGHELGHAAAGIFGNDPNGISDAGPNGMSNVLIYENPMRLEMGLSPRTMYSPLSRVFIH